MLKSKIGFRYVKGRYKGKKAKFNLKSNKINAYITVSDGLNKKTFSVGFKGYKKQKKRWSKADKRRLFIDIKQKAEDKFKTWVLSAGEGIVQANYVIVGRRFNKEVSKIKMFFEKSYSNTVKKLEDVRVIPNKFTGDIKDIIEVNRTLDNTRKDRVVKHFSFEANPKNHPSFILQMTDFNNMDNPELYKKLWITFNIKFIGIDGKEMSLPKNLYRFNFYDEVLKIRKKWLIRHFTPLQITLDKIRAELFKMNASMSSRIHQRRNPYNHKLPVLKSYTINITQEGIKDDTDGEFNKMYQKRVVKVMRDDKKERIALKKKYGVKKYYVYKTDVKYKKLHKAMREKHFKSLRRKK
jgi:hypothetical protein